MGNFAHYRLMGGDDIACAPAATVGDCIPYLVEADGVSRLCVIEGGAFHSFAISPLGVARLVEDGGAILRRTMEAG